MSIYQQHQLEQSEARIADLERANLAYIECVDEQRKQIAELVAAVAAAHQLLSEMFPGNSPKPAIQPSTKTP